MAECSSHWQNTKKKVVIQLSQTSIEQIRRQLRLKSKELISQWQDIQRQISQSNKENAEQRAKYKKSQENYIFNQRRVNPNIEEIRQNVQSCVNEEIPYFKNKDNYLEKQFQVSVFSSGMFYPPSCAGYDIAYCKGNDSVYIYGGISCNSQLTLGLKQYFYMLEDGVWRQVKSVSNYTPMPRYGHTLTGTHDSILLFGGVSEFKQKLKDRCFYPDVWSFSVHRNTWKIIQYSGGMVKARKNHAACTYHKYYIIQGGIDDNQQVISSISWVSLDEKKGRWRHKTMQGRYNHQICVHQTLHGRDFLFIFGGRNSESQIIGNFMMYPIYVNEGQLHFKEGFKFNWGLKPCEFPVMRNLENGIVIMGGIDQENEAAQQCWYFNPEKQTAVVVHNNIDWNELRAGKGVSVNGKHVYVLSGANSKKYKAIKIAICQPIEQDFRCKMTN